MKNSLLQFPKWNQLVMPLILLFTFFYSIPSFAQPDYSLTTTDSAEIVCPGDTAYYNIAIGSIAGYNNLVNLTISGLPAGATASFSINPVTPAGSSMLMVATNTAASGLYNLMVNSTSAAGNKSLALTLEIPAPIPPTPNTTLLSPLNGASNVPIPVVFSWSNVGTGYSYTLLVATDTNFTNLIENVTTFSTSYNSTAVQGNSSYYWYVMVTDTSIHNTISCGTGGSGSPSFFSFTTAPNCANFSTSTFLSDYNGYNVTCANTCDGFCIASANGGIPPYSYQWSDGQNTDFAGGLCPTNYEVTVTDANGCVSSDFVSLISPNPLNGVANISSNYNGHQVSCAGSCDGEATVSATGSVPPYSYLWDNGQTSTTNIGLCSGVQSVTVTELNLCTWVSNTSITSEPSAVSATISSSVNPTCLSCTDGSISASASGGTAAYTYLWNNSETSQNISGLAAGTYTVTITDLNGCQDVTSITLSVPTAITSLHASTPFDIVPNPNSGLFNINLPLLEIQTGTIQIYNIMGALVYEKILTKNMHTVPINKPELEAGTYFIHLSTHNNHWVRKLVVVH